MLEAPSTMESREIEQHHSSEQPLALVESGTSLLILFLLNSSLSDISSS